jgi:hypothetical protein
MPSRDPKIVKAYKDGIISKGQYDKLGEGMLLGIIKKKTGKGGTKKGEVRKTARRAYEPKKKSEGVKEVRKKIGKEKGKVGRPRAGTKVKVEK